MTTIGDRSTFAIEYQLSEKHGGAWMFGRFCFWIVERRLGDFEGGTSLRDVLFELENIAKYSGQRTNPRFALASTAEIVRLLDAALFAGGFPDETGPAIEEQWARHQILPMVDVFDRWKAFLVEVGDRGRFVTLDLHTNEVSEIALRAGEFDHCLSEAIGQLDKIYESARNES